MAKNILKTSFRFDAHAMDSTLKGCKAKKTATQAKGQMLFVVLFNKRNKSMTALI